MGDQLPESMRRQRVVFKLSELIDSVRHEMLNVIHVTTRAWKASCVWSLQGKRSLTT